MEAKTAASEWAWDVRNGAIDMCKISIHSDVLLVIQF